MTKDASHGEFRRYRVISTDTHTVIKTPRSVWGNFQTFVILLSASDRYTTSKKAIIEQREREMRDDDSVRNARKRKRRDLECTIAHAKTFSQVLSSIQLNSKSHQQKVKVRISNKGIGFTCLDASKSLKAQATFRKETFERFRVGFFGRGRRGGDDEEDEEEEGREEAEEEEEENDDDENENARRENEHEANDENNARNANDEVEVKKYVGMSLDAFVDVLEMFANRFSSSSSSAAEEFGAGQTVSLSYPDRHGRVALESNSVRETTIVGSGGGGNENQRGLRPLRQTTYADVATEANVFGEDEDEMNKNEDDEDRDEFLRVGRALVTFVLPTTRWKEIIEDLEWANANVTLIATRDSLAFVSESSDIGSVKVDVDLSSLVEYSFREAFSRGGRGEGQASPGKRKQKWTYKQDFLKRSAMVPTHSGAVTSTAGGTNNAFGQYRQTQSHTQTQGGGGGGGGGGHFSHHRHHHVETDEAYQATTKISVGETGVLKVAHMLRLRALLGQHQSNAFGNANPQNDGGERDANHHRGGASTCNVPVTFIMAPIVGDDRDDGMGSDDDDYVRRGEEEEDEEDRDE